MRIYYFLEDRAQETFVKSLVERVAREEGVHVQHQVRAASHGSRAFREFKNFVRDLKRGKTPVQFDLLIVALDGNCKGYAERARQIRKVLESSGFENRLICCIPDPHIERWYLLDLPALRQAVGMNIQVSTPPYKCKKDFYKRILGQALREVGSLLGGPEYVERIVRHMDF